MTTKDRELFAQAEWTMFATTQTVIKGGLTAERFKALASYTAGTLGMLAEVIGKPESDDIAQANQAVNDLERQVLRLEDPAFSHKERLLLVQLQAMQGRIDLQYLDDIATKPMEYVRFSVLQAA